MGYEIHPTRRWNVHSTINPFKVQVQIMEQLGISASYIFDIGANKGEITDNYRQLFPSSTVYCFEPFPSCVKMLEQKFMEDEKVVIVPKAIADKEGTADFYVNHFIDSNSLLPRPTEKRRYYHHTAGYKETIQVEITTIDQFVEENQIEKIDILKMDIQGGELNALKGANQLLESGKISIIYAEVWFITHYENNPLFHDLCKFLEGYSYSLMNIYHLVNAKNGQLRFGNAIFIHDDVRNKVLDQYPEEP
ncbi:MAG: FkbM family methyltransferase [Bacteroidota bacterium]